MLWYTRSLSHTHTHKQDTPTHRTQKNHKPKKNQELTHGFHIRLKVTFKFVLFCFKMWTIGQQPYKQKKNWIPLEAERVNSVKCKHPANDPVYTLSRWPALLIGKQQKWWMDSFCLEHMWYRGCHLRLYTSAPEDTLQTRQAKKRFLIYTYFKGGKKEVKFLISFFREI